ncbi:MULTISPECIES: hypothetical protein [unclassified Psychrobacter]|uniref:hypothetical protein n=1 Tax=unclassified Psychrobacter TaxID=196806 RepID=UPI0025B3C769|nr:MULTISPECIES: hypothetical protein [unclassified Psychrobacter]MDN3452595.1 hypothetical protein [Psychrobacter sp. APC 3350]MDN3502479.1 hypothetical protein [Psychrobacter sp. 5A.1]
MKQILKHSFEAVSLLTTNNGMLDVTIVPAVNQPDWIIPSSLILSVDECQQYISRYDWQQQGLAVFHLLPQDQVPEKIIVLEGNTIDHRFALQTAGGLRQLQARISEVKDVVTSEHSNGINIENTEAYFDKNDVSSYRYQTVMIDGETYLVPDLDKIAHYLIDLDG